MSSGGLINYFARPNYQEKAVTTYLTDHISDATKAYYQPFVNFSGRAFPDIAAHSDTPG